MKLSSWNLFRQIIDAIFPPGEEVQEGQNPPPAAHDGTTPLTRSSFKLPQVIVVGTEKTGKSTLIENFTKCAIFPRSEKLCTKTPVRLCLMESPTEGRVIIRWRGGEWVVDRDGGQVLARVTAIMDSLGPEEIVEDEVVVTIRGPNLPNFEFIDLPGIRAFPEKLARDTTNLTKKYLKERDTLVLVVVPANVPSFTGNQAIALVMEMEKQSKTIITMTMADRITDMEEFENLVVRRLLPGLEELTLDDERFRQFGGTVAVMNRLHADTVSLEDFGQIEIDKFQEKFRTLEEETDGFYSAMMDELQTRVTLPNAVRMLDGLFHNHIKEEWQPRAVATIGPMITDCKARIESLGVDPSNLSVTSLTTEVMRRLNHEAIRAGILRIPTEQTESYPSCPQLKSATLATDNSWDTWQSSEHLEGILSWIGEKNKSIFTTVVEEIVKIFSLHLERAFAPSVDHRPNLDMKLERFQHLCAAMKAFVKAEIGGPRSSLRENLDLCPNADERRDEKALLIKNYCTKEELTQKITLAVLLEVRSILFRFSELFLREGGVDIAECLIERNDFKALRERLTAQTLDLETKLSHIRDIDVRPPTKIFNSQFQTK